MTHDELLATINNLFDKGFDAEIKNAMLAVVELHKPNFIGDCCGCTYHERSNTYPCSTIQAITKQLA